MQVKVTLLTQRTEITMQQSQNIEDELKRTNRALRLLSASNQTLLRAHDESALLYDVCQISKAGFLGFSYRQTILPGETTDLSVLEGYGSGSFVVIRADKSGKGRQA